ncbi:MAG: zf-HC2 domain-containing protein [Acidobacteriota bacterium]
MECRHIQEHLSEYLERCLPGEEAERVAAHLHECGDCASVLEEMRSVLALCRSFPIYEPDADVLDRILLKTSGRRRTRTMRELLDQFVLRPMLTPRFAMGAVLATLFLVLVANFMLPRMTTVAASLSPGELFRMMDRGVQQIYGEGLKLYDKQNEWQEQFTFFKNNLFNRLGIMIERLDVPVEGKKKPGETQRQQERSPSNHSSLLLLRA